MLSILSIACFNIMLKDIELSIYQVTRETNNADLRYPCFDALYLPR